jgi:surfeit locus 1 family protein
VLVLLLRPKFWPGHLAMVVAVAIAAGLGLWQLDAWKQHRADAARDLANDPPVALSRVMTGDSPFPGRSLGQPVTFSGSWLGSGTVYVADRVLHGRTGYWVVTPVLVSGTQSAMPVVRGWSATASAPVPSGIATVTGWLQASESSEVDDDPHDDVIPTMRIASMVEHVDADLYSGYVVAKVVATGSTTELAGQGLEAVTPAAVPPVSSFTAARNLFYAVEWWVFGAFALFIWVRWCRDTLAPQEEPEPTPSPDPVNEQAGTP